VLSLLDRLSLAAFLTAGLAEYYTNPAGLDQVSVRQKAEAAGVTPNAIHNVLVPLTSGLATRHHGGGRGLQPAGGPCRHRLVRHRAGDALK
jgi:hypothetical protein